MTLRYYVLIFRDPIVRCINMLKTKEIRYPDK